VINVSTSMGRFVFNRAVPLGYVFFGNSTFALESASADEIVIAQPAFDGHYHFVHHPHFYARSTNNYTLDYSINFADSYSFIGGMPFTINCNLDFGYLPGEFSPRIMIDFGVGFDVVMKVPLNAVNSPWYVRV
jgi:hypothetical protein